MKKTALLTLAFATAATASAQVSLTSFAYSENFDTLDSTGSFSSTAGVQGAIPSTPANGWVGTKASGTGTSPMPWVVSNGSSSTGGLYSFGATGSGERALGTLASGSNVPNFGVEFINATGIALESITISFFQENWRSSTVTENVVHARWARSSEVGASSSNFLTFAGFNDADNLDLVGPAAVGSNGPLDGNDPLNQAARVQTFTFAVPLAVGESFFLRFEDFNEAGNDAGLAIDNFELTANPVPEPATLLALGLGVLAAARRRRK